MRVERSDAAASSAPAASTSAADTPTDDAEDVAARYDPGPEIGRGAMGRVVQAHDLRLDRTVAVKEELAPGQGRIEREARVTARIEHPGVVPIHDVGVTADGRFFFAMRLVRGRSLAELARAAATAEERQRLVRAVLAAAEAVAYAHHLGVVHRDLKPGNVMVGAFGETQVVDWGLARHVDEAVDPRERGRVVGTPRTMAPEQAAGEVADKRSDVWSLGCILYEVVCGRPAFAGDDREAILAAVQLASWTPPDDLGPELAAILRRAMAATPEARYPDAKAFADDLARWLDGRRVAAYAYRTRDLVRRFAARHRVALIVAGVALLTLAVLGAVAIVNVLDERAEAVAARAESERNLGRALVGQAASALAAGACPEAELLAAEGHARVADPAALGVLASCEAAPRPERLGVEPLPPACAEPDLDPAGRWVLCGAEDAVALWDRAARAVRWRLATPHASAVLQAGGREVFVAGTPRGDLTLDAADGRVLATAKASVGRALPGGDGPALMAAGVAVTFAASPALGLATMVVERCPDTTLTAATRAGAWLAWCRTGEVFTADGRHLRTALSGLHDEPTAIALGDDEVVVGTSRGELVRVDLRDGAVLARGGPVLDGVIRAIDRSPDGAVLAVSGERGGVVLAQATTLVTLGRLPADAARAARFVGAELVTIGAALERWRVASGRPAIVPAPGGVTAVALDAAGALLVAHGASVTEHDPRGRVTGTWSWQPHVVKGAAWSGGLVVGVSVVDHGLAVGDRETGALVRHDTTMAYRRVAALADGSVLVAGYTQGLFRAWPPDAPSVRVDDVATDLAASPDGRFAAWLREGDGALVVYDAATAASAVLAHEPAAAAVAPSGRGDAIYAGLAGGVARLDARGLDRWLECGCEVIEVQADAADRLVAAGARDGRVFVWSAADAAVRLVTDAHRQRVPALAFDPTGRLLASGSWDATVRVLDLSVLDLAPDVLRSRALARWGRDLARVIAR